MKKVMLLASALLISLLSTSALADPIEGAWRVDEKTAKSDVAKLANDQQFFVAMILGRLEEIVFLQNGKLNISKTGEQGIWRKSNNVYSLIPSPKKQEDSLSLQATLSLGASNKKQLKLQLLSHGKPIVPLYFTPYIAPPSVVAANAKAKSLIQYNRLYRSAKKSSGGYNYLKINNNNTCQEKAIAKNEGLSADFGSVGPCAIFDGYLVMQFGAKAEVISKTKIKYMNMIFVLQP